MTTNDEKARAEFEAHQLAEEAKTAWGRGDPKRLWTAINALEALAAHRTASTAAPCDHPCGDIACAVVCKLPASHASASPEAALDALIANGQELEAASASTEGAEDLIEKIIDTVNQYALGGHIGELGITGEPVPKTWES